MVAGEGLEPTTSGYEPDELPTAPPRAMIKRKRTKTKHHRFKPVFTRPTSVLVPETGLEPARD